MQAVHRGALDGAIRVLGAGQARVGDDGQGLRGRRAGQAVSLELLERCKFCRCGLIAVKTKNEDGNVFC
jgi:hypothetical protein